jgi:hypothetical protein
MTSALVFALVLTGCGKKDGETKSAPAPAPAAPTVNLQDGEWEITTQVNMPGMPQNMPQRPAVKVCLSKKDFMPKPMEKADPQCKHDSKISGNSVTFNVVCPDATVTGTYTYAGTSFEGKSQTKMKADGKKEMVIDSVIKGKYVGPCPPEKANPQPAQPAQPQKK